MRTIPLLVAVLVIGGCTSATTSRDTSAGPSEASGASAPPSDATVAESQKARLTADAAAPANVQNVSDDNLAFGVSLYRELAAEEGAENVFFSPHSISTAFSMLYAGAAGNTKAEMQQVFSLNTPEPELHHAMNALDLYLDERNETDGVTLRVVNATWGQRGYGFLPSFLDVLAESYGSSIYLLDFRVDPEGSRETINAWVSDNTNERIEELLPEGIITPATVLTLTNAVYFNAAWHHEFDPAHTRDASFTTLDGSVVDAPLMTQQAELGYAAGSGYQAVALPYAGEELSLVAILPDDLSAFEAGFTSEGLRQVVANLTVGTTEVWFPRLSYGATTDLKSVLQALGMVDAFSGSADLSGIDGTRNLFVSAAVHEANIDVTEEGTEAAAATAVVVGDDDSAAGIPQVRFERPFLFAIVDGPTGAVLFLGRVVNPLAP